MILWQDPPALGSYGVARDYWQDDFRRYDGIFTREYVLILDDCAGRVNGRAAD